MKDVFYLLLIIFISNHSYAQQESKKIKESILNFVKYKNSGKYSKSYHDFLSNNTKQKISYAEWELSLSLIHRAQADNKKIKELFDKKTKLKIEDLHVKKKSANASLEFETPDLLDILSKSNLDLSKPNSKIQMTKKLMNALNSGLYKRVKEIQKLTLLKESSSWRIDISNERIAMHKYNASVSKNLQTENTTTPQQQRDYNKPSLNTDKLILNMKMSLLQMRNIMTDIKRRFGVYASCLHFFGYTPKEIDSFFIGLPERAYLSSFKINMKKRFYNKCESDQMFFFTPSGAKANSLTKTKYLALISKFKAHQPKSILGIDKKTGQFYQLIAIQVYNNQIIAVTLDQDRKFLDYTIPHI